MQMRTKTTNCDLHPMRRPLIFKRYLRDERGTSLLEMALLTPLLILILLGIIEIGRYADLSIVVANAARAGAQYGGQNLVTAADSTGIANAATSDGQGLTNLTVTSQPVCGCPGTQPTNGQCTTLPSCGTQSLVVYLQVNATETFNSLFNYPGIPSPITLNGADQVRVGQ